jgi:uncharacterized protein (TIGR04141 family)
MTQDPKIYKIDKEHLQLRRLSTTEEIIEKVLNTSFSKLNINSRFDSDKLNISEIEGFVYYLYLYNSDEIVSDWKHFLPSDLTQDKDFKHQKLSLVLFIESADHLYCVIGGSAFQIILPFIDKSFGLNVYSRIITPQKDEISSIKSRGITGSRAGINEQFRDNYRIIDYIKFGKITQEIHVKLCIETTDTHFHFLKTNAKDRIQIFAGKAIKIKKKADFRKLHQVIKELNIILGIAPSDYLDSYKEVTDKDRIRNILYPKLITSIFDDTENLNKRSTNAHKSFHHDFCNPNNIQKFYEADEFQLKEKTDKGGYSIFKKVNNRNEIYDAVLNRGVEKHGVSDRFNFMVFLQGVRVVAYQDGKKTVASSFLYHISAEFLINGKPTFLLDTKWYQLQDSFIDDLKKSTIHILSSYKAPNSILHEPWNKSILKREGNYNDLYDLKDNYIVIDTIIVDGIELCDIMYYDNSNLYLIHVKFGFESKIRELSNQITISARRLKDELVTKDKLFIEKLYDKLVNKKRNINGLSQDDFKKLFDKRISYIMAFTSQLSEDLSIIENIDKFSSNIARYSLIHCSKEMRTEYYDLLNYQIPRS